MQFSRQASAESLNSRQFVLSYDFVRPSGADGGRVFYLRGGGPHFSYYWGRSTKEAAGRFCCARGAYLDRPCYFSEVDIVSDPSPIGLAADLRISHR